MGKSPARCRSGPADSTTESTNGTGRRKDSATPLTESERRFCHEYAVDHNGTRAYRLCFPTQSCATARANASRLLTKANIRREIAAIEAEHLRATRITARRVLRELAAIAFYDVCDVFESGPDGMPRPRDWDTIPIRSRRVISNVKVKRRKQVGMEAEWIVEELDYKFHDKLSALDKLAKHLGLTDNGEALRQLLELIGQGNRPVTDPANSAPQPTEGPLDTHAEWRHDGPAGDKAATAGRPADKALPANG